MAAPLMPAPRCNDRSRAGNAILDIAGFDPFVEEQCRQLYAPVMGRPGLAPGHYFRLVERYPNAPFSITLPPGVPR